MNQKQKYNKPLLLSTDGGARGNPGPAGLGFVITTSTGELLMQRGRYLGETTNNVAEYQALIDGLTAVIELGADSVVIRMDSELIVKQMTGEYKIKQPHLQNLAAQVQAQLQKLSHYEFQHVLREYNKAADQMVNEAIDAALGLSKKPLV
ncbi:MAG TPA: ribonuclease HI family protein [Candidatus Doudnabacteria bacterium]|nr:ribonuclease HI family protein [Candidatus Doudnabacteria bacterium]